MRISYQLFTFILIGIISTASISASADSHIPKGGYVPDEETACAIAEAVLQPIFGKSFIQDQKPFKAFLKGDVWQVVGSAPVTSPGVFVLGGRSVIFISKQDGHIIKAYSLK